MALGKKSGGGSRKGKPNKATADVRAAFAEFVSGNVGKFQDWVEGVAEGHREPRIVDGKPVLDEKGDPVMKWLRPPDPGYALRLVADIAEYHIPKLARTEIKAADGEKLQSVNLVFVTKADT